MAIPQLLDSGLLPPGVHSCTLAEAEARFVPDGASEKRRALWESLRAFLAWITPMQCFEAIYLDGSFITDKVEPSDIDCILEVSLTAPFPPEGFQALDQPRVKAQFGLDVYARHPSMQNDFALFFQYVKVRDCHARGLPNGARKGILRITL